MEIIKLKGEDQQLYYLVAHLVMNEEVLEYNLKYPFKTSPDYRWFIAVEKGDTLGFMPVKLNEEKAILNNYYVADDDSEVFSQLLQEVVRTFRYDFDLEAVVQKQHIPFFEQCGFSITVYWTMYVKMKLFKDEKKRL